MLALEWVKCPGRANGRGDATGARSGPPCQDVLYYNTHLAV